MSTSLPWTAAGAAISATSNGGVGSTWYLGEFGVEYVFTSAGDGGDVTVGLSGGDDKPFEINIGAHKGLQASASAPFVAVNAVSRGGGFYVHVAVKRR
jgi:hypothetical protein